jgi:hypothetical protein
MPCCQAKTLAPPISATICRPSGMLTMPKPSMMLLIELLDMHKRLRRKERLEERQCVSYTFWLVVGCRVESDKSGGPIQF